MDINYTREKIIFDKDLNSLDIFVIDFTAVLNKLNIPYVIVSGYVSILFGRNRASEDIDLILKKLDLKKFQELFTELNQTFACITTDNAITAYQEYLSNHTSIRFSPKGNYVPNIELKFVSENQSDNFSLQERVTVQVNGHTLFISPLELQIAFKVFLGSEKDIEDAVYLYELFKDKLDLTLLRQWGRKLNIVGTLEKYLA